MKRILLLILILVLVSLVTPVSSHLRYYGDIFVLRNGEKSLTGDWDVGGFSITNIDDLDVNGNTTLGDNATDTVVIQGDTYWVGDGTGLPFGEIYFDGGVGGAGSFGVVVTDIGDAGKIQITGFDTNGFTNNCTSNHTNDEIKIVKAGIYNVFIVFSASASNNDDYEVVVYVDSGSGPVDTSIHAHRSVRANGAVGNFGDSGHLDLAVDDEVEVYLVKLTSDGVSRTLTIEHAKLHLNMLGGT